MGVFSRESLRQRKPTSDDTICRLAWSHAFVGSSGQVKPCCRFRSDEVPKEQVISTERDLLENIQSPFMQKIREAMLRGEAINGCQRCYEEEESHKDTSLRRIYNADEFIHSELPIGKIELRYLELSSSNLCNLACRMCEPRYSVRWAQDWEALHGKKSEFAKLRSVDVNALKPYLGNIRHIKFTGGEPFLIQEYIEVLEEIVCRGIAHNVYLNYSTNLTVFPSKRLLELWRQFKHVEIAFSLDGIGPVNEYVRYPSKWNVVEENVAKLLQLSHDMNVRCGLRPTIMIYNIYDLPNIFHWWQNQVDQHYIRPFSETSWFNPTHVTYPQYLSLQVLPKEIKADVRDTFEAIDLLPRVNRALMYFCDYMDDKDDSRLLPEFIRCTEFLDLRREQSCRALHPMLASIFN